MVSEIRIYLEGAKQLAPAMSQFLSEVRGAAGRKRCRFKVVACRDSATTVKDFCFALDDHPDAWNLLLVDSDGPYSEQLLTTLKQREYWNPPHGAGDVNTSVFWMVQVMETWFLADPEALVAYYKAGFRRKALKPNPEVEQIPKDDVLSSLDAATKESSKGRYHKTRHAPQILMRLKPNTVRESAPSCRRLFDALFAAVRS